METARVSSSRSGCGPWTRVALLTALLLAGPLVHAASTAYEIVPAPDSADAAAWIAGNPAQGFTVRFDETAVRLTGLASALRLQLTPATLAVPAASLDSTPLLGTTKDGIGVEYRRGSELVEAFSNTPSGLRQRLVLAAPPAELRSLALAIGTSGDAVPKLDDTRNEVVFQQEGVAVARLVELTAVDAAGLQVPVALVVEGRAIRLELTRLEAAWPVTIDATYSTGKGPRAVPGGAAALPEALAPLAPPANDDCSGAETIPAAGPFPHSTALVDLTDGTSTGDPETRPGCAGGADPVTRSVWYAFTPAASGTYTFTTCADSGLTGTTVDDTVLAIYTSSGGCGGTFTQVPGACDDDSCDIEDFQSFIATPLSAGTTYYIVAWSLGDPTVGNTEIQLLVTASFVPNPPANDLCGGAEVIPPAGPFPHLTAVTADVTDATTAGDPPAPSCGDAGSSTSRSIWYEFTPSASGIYVFSTCSGDRGGTATTLADPILAIYTSDGGCGGTFTEIPTAGLSDGCDDDTCTVSTYHATITTQMTGGVTYYLVVSKVGSSVPLPGQAAVQLRVESVTAPTNDVCSGAVALTLDHPVTGSTEQAGDDYHSPSTTDCYSGIAQTLTTAPGRDVVYSFTAPATDKYSFRVRGYNSALNAVAYVSSDCPAGPPPSTVTCLRAANRNTSNPAEEVPCVAIDSGVTVYAIVDEFAISSGSPFVVEVNRCVEEVESNDSPAAAAPLTCGVEGSIGAFGDVDYFSLGSPAADARVFALADGSAGGSTDFDARMTTAIDTIEYDDLNLDTPFGALSPTLGGTKAVGGPAFLRLTTFSALTVSEPYRLYSAVRPPSASATPETEPNDSIAQANLQIDGYYSGALSGASPSADVDVFAVDAVTGDLILAVADGDPVRDATPLNVKLALLDSGGSVLVEVNDGDQISVTTSGAGGTNKSTPRSPAEGIAWRAMTSGRYYVRVTAGSSSTTTAAGDYLLSISLNCQTPDDDGDGVLDGSDCAPTNGGVFAIPGIPSQPSFAADKQSMTWTSAGGGTATTHDVLRGSLAAFPVGPGGGDEVCFNDLGSPALQDPAVPAAGQGFWYLIRGSNSCGTGSYGFEEVRGTPGTERTSTSCP